MWCDLVVVDTGVVAERGDGGEFDERVVVGTPHRLSTHVPENDVQITFNNRAHVGR